jgi:hypothetical protein
MMPRSAVFWVCLSLVACGRSTHDSPELGEGGSDVGGSSPGVAGGGAGDAGTSPLQLAPVGGAPATDPVPVVNGCSCPGEGFGVTVALGDDTRELRFNVASATSSCTAEQPAHARIRSGCGQHVTLDLSAEVNGALPQLSIDDATLTYTDGDGKTWTGFMPSSLGVIPDVDSVVAGALDIQVNDQAGLVRPLHLTFKLCAEIVANVAIC